MPEAREIDPNLPWPCYRRVMALLDLGRKQDALTAANDALERFPADVTIVAARGRVYESLGEKGEATAAYRQALAGWDELHPAAREPEQAGRATLFDPEVPPCEASSPHWSGLPPGSKRVAQAIPATEPGGSPGGTPPL